MNKNEIIKILQELPNDLPIIFRQKNDRVTPIGYPIRSIQVTKAYKSFYDSYIKYSTIHDNDKNVDIVDVIWIE